MISELWTKYSTLTIRHAINHVNKYKHLLKWRKNGSVLEVGCGDGMNAKEVLLPNLPNDYKEFYISDKHPEFIKYIERNVITPKLKVFKLDLVDDEVPKQLENRFDHIFGFFVLHMLMEPRKALVNIHKMLKPGGQTFLTFFEYVPIDDILKKMEVHSKWGKYAHAISAYSYHENPLQAYTQDFIAAGFKDATYNTEMDTWELGVGPEWEHLFVSLDPTLSKLPESEKEDYIRDFVKYGKFIGSPEVKPADGKLIRKLVTKTFVVVANKS